MIYSNFHFCKSFEWRFNVNLHCRLKGQKIDWQSKPVLAWQSKQDRMKTVSISKLTSISGISLLTIAGGLIFLCYFQSKSNHKKHNFLFVFIFLFSFTEMFLWAHTGNVQRNTQFTVLFFLLKFRLLKCCVHFTQTSNFSVT